MKKSLCLFLSLCLLFAGLTACANPAALPENGILINEVVTGNKHSLNDAVYGSPDWIELYNGSDQDVNLSGYYLTDNIENPDKLSPLPRQVLKAGEYLVLFANGESGETCLSFSLSRKGETLTLVNPHKEEVYSLVIPPMEKDVSYARREDGTYGYCRLPTPGAYNSGDILEEPPASSLLLEEGDGEYAAKTDYEAVLFNELLSRGELVYCPDCGRYVDCIELYNPGMVTANLKGYSLSNEPEDNKVHNLPEADLNGLHYLLLYGCDAGCACSDGHVCLDFGLSRYGETLYLFDPLGNMLDTVELPPMEKSTTYARRSDGSWGVCLLPTLGAENADGDIGAAPAASDTPAIQQQGAVRINEALAKNIDSIIDTDGDRSDFCELYNQGQSALSLKGWYLSDDPGKLEKWALPDITLEPGAYLLVFLSGKDRTEGELHASFSLSVGETLTLYNSADGTYDALYIPETWEGVSVGRDETGAAVYYGMPTPGYANGHSFPLPSPTAKAE